MLHLLDAVYKLVGPDIISAACKVLQVSLADYTVCSVFLRGHHMCVVAWNAIVDGLYRLYKAKDDSLLEESEPPNANRNMNTGSDLPRLVAWTTQTSFVDFVKLLGKQIPAIAEAIPFILVLGPCVQGLYISIRSGWVHLTRGITSIIGPMFAVVGKHNYDKLCHQMNAFWLAMTPLQQFAIGCTYTVHTSQHSLHNQAGDETLESTLNKLVACTKGNSEEIRNK
jgi:hypothetical protein